jgi:hypothetical protein
VAAESASASAWEEGIVDLPRHLFYLCASLQLSRRFFAAVLPSSISEKSQAAQVERVLGTM